MFILIRFKMHLAGSVKSKIMWKFYQRDIWLIAVFICSSMQEVHSRNPPHCSKKWSIPLRISSVNVTISAVSCVLKKSLMDNFIFCAVSLIDVLNLEHGTITIWNIGQSWSISNCEKASLVAVLLLSFLLDTVREIFFYITQGM